MDILLSPHNVRVRGHTSSVPPAHHSSKANSFPNLSSFDIIRMHLGMWKLGMHLSVTDTRGDCLFYMSRRYWMRYDLILLSCRSKQGRALTEAADLSP